MKARVGRADLLRALQVLEGRETTLPANVLGFALDSEAPQTPLFEAQPVEQPSERMGPPAPTPGSDAFPHLRLEHARATNPELATRPPRLREVKVTSRPERVEPLTCAPLAPWSRLWPALDELLRTQRASRRIDVPRMVSLLARMRRVRRIPRRREIGTVPHVSVFLDWAPRLIPFWFDFEEVERLLVRTLGAHAVTVWRWDRLPTPELATRWIEETQRLSPDTNVLVLGDLGHYGSPNDRWAWANFGEALRREGFAVGALIPVPLARWDRSVTATWNAHAWERSMNECAMSSPRRQLASMLLRLLAPAVRLEPWLLRAVRLLLPEADAGTEADVWNSEEMLGWSASAGTLRRESQQKRRRELAYLQRLQPDLVSNVTELLRRAHAGYTDVWNEEVPVFASVGSAGLHPGDIDRAEEHHARLADALEREPDDDGERTDLRVYLEGFMQRASDETLASPAVRRIHVKLHGEAATVEREQRRRAPNTAEETRCTLWQVGSRLELHPEGVRPVRGTLSVGSPLGFLRAAVPTALIQVGGAEPIEVDLGDASGIELGDRSAVLVTDLDTLELERRYVPPWASDHASDRFGHWASFTVGDVEHRMRWIPPGSYWQGSPETEAGRYDNERRRFVRFTRGFWLGETPVTQALWEAVMKANPSRFRSSDRPVERVSHEDCVGFLETLKAQVPGLSASLPDEARWEYACRAGTATATYAGEIEILGVRNAPILHEIAWYGGNSGVEFDLEEGHDSSDWPEKQFEHRRAGTRRVKRKLPNAFGLYDMLGNVWEWCADAWDGSSGYPPDDIEDPVASREGRARVDRGGSWFYGARAVRAACRDAAHPGHRDGSVGFRLAEVPESRAQP